MAGKISELPAVVSPNDADLLELVNSAVSKRMSLAQLRTFFTNSFTKNEAQRMDGQMCPSYVERPLWNVLR